MAAPNEIFEDLTDQVTDTQTIFKVTKAPYVPGTLNVWSEGILQSSDFATEIDPTLGLFQIDEPILIRDPDDHGLIVSYGTFEPVFIEPDTPVHISQLKFGETVRIAMKPGRHLEPVLRPKDKQIRLIPGRTGSGKSLRARNYSRTVFLGFITLNDSVSGKLILQVRDRQYSRNHLEAHIPYKDILVIRKFITPGEASDVDDVVIGAGGDAIRRPGVIAKGFGSPKGFLKLVKVFF